MGVALTLLNSISAFQLVSIFVIATAAYVVLERYYLRADPLDPLKSLKPLPPARANNKNRSPGTWTPEILVTPPPKPFQDWNIHTTKPLPYRAFKHKYTVNMGIRSMEFDEWIQLDNEWLKYHDAKLKRIQDKGQQCYGTLPEAYAPALEVLGLLRDYLPVRYPTLFERTSKGIYNKVTTEDFDFETKPLKEDPMLMCSKLLQDDVAIMVEMPDGQYYLKGGAIFLAGFWRLKDKLNLPLSAIHTTGDVPKYNTNLKSGMEKFFIRQTPDKPVVRNNYFIQTDDDLAWSNSIGDEDKEEVGWYTAPKATDVSKIYFRSERQSLRKLPLTGATLFTIRTYFLPVVELCKEPYIPRRLLDGINSWSEDVEEYRGLHAFKDVLLPYLEQKAQEQEAAGFKIEDEPKDAFPF